MTRLEEEIQSKFSSEYHKLTVGILYTHGRLVAAANEVLKPYGLTLQQFNILRILRGQMPHAATVSLLKERMLDKMSDASRLVERLRTKGFIERRTSAEDRRQANISITKKGLETLERIGDFDGILTAVSKVVTEEDARTTNKTLDNLRDALGA
ncbi:MAG: MarR family transcriptional regulator [Bacteroidia bacterium]|nr:MarR family transcriptional regulator [Bacteroidia bacterium]